MKGLKSFFIWFFSAVTVFFAVASAIILPKALNKTADTPESKFQETALNPKYADLLVIYRDGDSCFACQLTLNFSILNVNSTKINLPYTDSNDESFEFAQKCQKATHNNTEKFVILSQESFIKIVDKSHGLVYNNGNGDFLLTGAQCLDILTADNFNFLCQKAAKSAIFNNLEDYFVFLTQNTVNNLSYPSFYDILH